MWTVPAYRLTVTTPDPILENWRWTVFDKSDGLAGGVIDVYEAPVAQDGLILI